MTTPTPVVKTKPYGAEGKPSFRDRLHVARQVMRGQPVIFRTHLRAPLTIVDGDVNMSFCTIEGDGDKPGVILGASRQNPVSLQGYGGRYDTPNAGRGAPPPVWPGAGGASSYRPPQAQGWGSAGGAAAGGHVEGGDGIR